jgi:hypothetical protein
MQSLFFCDECGAANPIDATSCFACQHPLTLAPPTAQATPAGPQRQQQQFQVQESAGGPLVPGMFLKERYVILEEIGHGGFGVVYKARDERQTGRLVAVKQIQLQRLSPREIIQATDSYNRETTLQPWLRQRGIPHIADHFTDAENWYLVMDYIPGETLEETLQRAPSGKLSVWEVLEIGIQLCDILKYLHEQEIVFRDVKPANIMRTARGRVYLIDFGIARRYEARKAKDTSPLGSPGYAAPEQYGTAQSTPRTDMYGLGATLLTLLTGKDLSEHALADVLADPAVPPSLRDMLSRMLKQRPEQRPDSLLVVKWHLLANRARFPAQRKRDRRAFVLHFLLGSALQTGYALLLLLSALEARIAIESHIFFASFSLIALLIPCLNFFLFADVAGFGLLALLYLRNPGKKWHGLGLLLGVFLSTLLLVVFRLWPFGF